MASSMASRCRRRMPITLMKYLLKLPPASKRSYSKMGMVIIVRPSLQRSRLRRRLIQWYVSIAVKVIKITSPQILEASPIQKFNTKLLVPFSTTLEWSQIRKTSSSNQRSTTIMSSWRLFSLGKWVDQTSSVRISFQQINHSPISRVLSSIMEVSILKRVRPRIQR